MLADVQLAIWLAVALSVARIILKRSLGQWLTSRFIPQKPMDNPLQQKLDSPALSELTPLFAQISKNNREVVESVLKKYDSITEEDLAGWVRFRKAEIEHEKIVAKYNESLFKVLAYGFAWTSLVWAILNDPNDWISDTKNSFRNFPDHPITPFFRFVYMFEVGLYVHFAMFQFIDTRRQDFWIMFFHHIATLALLMAGWMSFSYRVGTLILVAHDVADVFLEISKLFKYANQEMLTNICFVLFAVSWFFSRLFFYPLWAWYAGFYYSSGFIAWFPRVPAQFLLMCLQILHVYWFCLILRIVYKFTTEGEVDDERSLSDTDDESSSTHAKNAAANRPLKAKRDRGRENKIFLSFSTILVVSISAYNVWRDGLTPFNELTLIQEG
eukprot:GABV01000369.1.p1 GENE.GABV01000369.1~~GABV01000369.1.p1  ORF type:complete len:428 (+),score=180.17 GABV01000369.1:135-1286(+)